MGRTETLLVNMKEKIGQMQKGFAGLNVCFDTQALRLDRHAALIQTGSRWTARMNEWSEKVDAPLEAKDQQIAALTERIRKLEQN